MSAEPKIITTFIYPPIPIRTCDWQATRDGYEPGDPIGHGPTEQAAIQDLLIEEDARSDGQPSTDDLGQQGEAGEP